MRKGMYRKMAAFIAILVVICANSFSLKAEARTSDLFPRYPSLKTAVDFWKKIYTQYTTQQGLIHDDRYLDIVYEVVELDDPKCGGSEKRNKLKINSIKDKYLQILDSLANGKAPVTEDEKRVVSLFGKRATTGAFRAAKEGIRFQLGQKDRFRQGIIRSGMYLEEIRRIFRSHGLPEELAYLPHVESSFDYEAYSKLGAAGIWQFTHSTGKQYMTIDYTRDDRRDPIRSTHAAAKHLKHNYEVLGNWPMALTAYNHGLTGMVRAKKAGSGDFEAIIREYNGSSFGFASRNFYAEFLAALEIATNHEQFFGNLQLYLPVRAVEVELPGYISAKEAADHFKTDLKTLQELNLALRKPVFLGQKYIPKGYRLRLPAQPDPKGLAYQLSAKTFRPQQLPSRFYRVQKGDTTTTIARSLGVKLSDLLKANGLSSQVKIYPGQNLRIPAITEPMLLASASPPASKKGKEVLSKTSDEKATPNPAQQADESKKNDGTDPIANRGSALQPPELPQGTPQPPASFIESKESAALVSKTVVTGESISPPAPLTPAESPKNNGVERATDSGEASPPAVTPQGEPHPHFSPMEAQEDLNEVNTALVTGDFQIEKVVTEGKQKVGIIKVEEEETLGHYADWLGVSTQAIRRLNKLSPEKPIRTNEKIKIPLTKTGKGEFEEKRYEYHKEMEEDFFSVYRIDGETLYTLKAGENIWTLCQDTFDLPLWLIQKYNEDQNLTMLQPNQKLRLPTVQKITEECR